MMRLLLPVLLLIVGVGGGVGAGILLGGGEEDPSIEEVSAAEEEATTTDDAGPEEEAEEVDSDLPRVEPTGEGTEYVRLNNQFVVPIVRNGSVRSLVVLGLTVEVTIGQNNLVFDQEPRLRDSFLRVLFAHANIGGFDGVFTESDALDPLREGLREAAQSVLGRDVAYDVLITDITRQDA